MLIVMNVLNNNMFDMFEGAKNSVFLFVVFHKSRGFDRVLSLCMSLVTP